MANNETVEKAAESVSEAKELLSRYNVNISREEDLIEGYSNLQDSYGQVNSGTDEEDDYKALAWDMAQAQELLQQPENIPEDQYKPLFELYEGIREEVRDGEFERSEDITEYRHEFFDSELEMTHEDLQAAAEKELEK